MASRLRGVLAEAPEARGVERILLESFWRPRPAVRPVSGGSAAVLLLPVRPR
jgi:hypothetical protein